MQTWSRATSPATIVTQRRPNSTQDPTSSQVEPPYPPHASLQDWSLFVFPPLGIIICIVLAGLLCPQRPCRAFCQALQSEKTVSGNSQIPAPAPSSHPDDDAKKQARSTRTAKTVQNPKTYMFQKNSPESLQLSLCFHTY